MKRLNVSMNSSLLAFANRSLARQNHHTKPGERTQHRGSKVPVPLTWGNGDEIHIENFDRDDVFNSSTISSFEFDNIVLAYLSVLPGVEIASVKDNGTHHAQWAVGRKGSEAANDAIYIKTFEGRVA